MINDVELHWLNEVLKESDQILDFARRMCFKGWKLTRHRSERLWSEVHSFLIDCLVEGATGWESGKNRYGRKVLACDWFIERFDHYVPNTPRWDKRYERGDDPIFYRLLRCVCRASLDLIDEGPHAGVWGFTIGDIRRMYDGQFPDFLKFGLAGEPWIKANGEVVDITAEPDETTLGW